MLPDSAPLFESNGCTLRRLGGFANEQMVAGEFILQ